MSSETSCINERITSWKDRWDTGNTQFHMTEINPMLKKYLENLIPEGKASRIFFPLCGKAIDMKWLADMGHTVVGVDGVQTALEQFFKEQELEYILEDMSSNGGNIHVYKSKDGRIRLYCCDILNFTSEFEGTVDAVWDRGSLIALDRRDVPGYVQVIKKLLSSRSRILLEVVEYDVSIMDDVVRQFKPPPPYPMYESELKALYEPECTVEFLGRYQQVLAGKNVNFANYLIVRKS